MRAVREARIAAQRIGAPATHWGSASDAPTRVVEHLLAVQAQDLPHALWAVGARAIGTTRADVVAALDRGEVVRSWPMRGTLHLVRPDDLRMLLSLTATRTIRQTARRRAELGLTDDVVALARDRAVALLDGGRSAPRDAVLADLRAAGIDTTAGRGTHLLLHLSVEGLIALGPSDGRGQSVVLLDEWAPATAAVPDHDEALRRAVTGYLRGRGPATEADAASWLKLPLGEVRTGIALAEDTIARYDDTRFVLAAEPQTAAPEPSAPAPSAGPVHLLPGFDEYLIAYADRTAQADTEAFQRVVPGGNGIFFPMLVVRGQVCGTWRATPPSARKDLVAVRVEPFAPVSAATERAIATAAKRYGAFLGAPVETRVEAAATTV